MKKKIFLISLFLLCFESKAPSPVSYQNDSQDQELCREISFCSVFDDTMHLSREKSSNFQFFSIANEMGKTSESLDFDCTYFIDPWVEFDKMMEDEKSNNFSIDSTSLDSLDVQIERRESRIRASSELFDSICSLDFYEFKGDFSSKVFYNSQSCGIQMINFESLVDRKLDMVLQIMGNINGILKIFSESQFLCTILGESTLKFNANITNINQIETYDGKNFQSELIVLAQNFLDYFKSHENEINLRLSKSSTMPVFDLSKREDWNSLQSYFS